MKGKQKMTRKKGRQSTRHRSVLFLMLMLLLGSCEPPIVPLPGVTGKSGELVVVMSKNQWKGPAGDTVFSTLGNHVYGLPQPEPMFNVVHIASAAFTRIFQTHRNIVHINIGKELQPSIRIRTDVWATPQIVVEITAPNKASFIDIFGANAQKIIAHILKKEQQRILKSYRAQPNYDVLQHLKTEFNMELDVPAGYNLVASGKDFSWVRYDTKDVTQSVLVYTEPYQRENSFTQNGMLQAMNAACKKHIPGPDVGTYMTTYPEYPPRWQETALGNVYASKLTGLWRVEGALMGGPFITYTLLDKERNRLIHICGFVFAPGKKKRNYVRQIDAIINSLNLL